ncbi:MAG TPA: hypothetical protein VKB89_29975 [Xanthobacteraceae bacterium]|nr:hypothetical protein [Xanthobacteraceae bacterium]
MKYDDHCINLGRLWGNLQSLEVDLRLFLTQANPSKNYITSQDTFGTLVGEYNRQLSKDERSLYFADASVIDIRSALAHGLVIGGRRTRFPLTLLHKGQQAEMTAEWFDNRRTLVRKQEERILACGKSRWPQLAWWGQ